MSVQDFSVLEHLPDPVIILDRNNRIRFLNAHAANLGGIFQPGITTGVDFIELVPHVRQDLVRAILHQVRTEKFLQTHEIEFNDTKGKPYYIELASSPAIDREGNISYTCVFLREISNERIFQKKASQLAFDFSTLIERANAVIFGLDSQEYITDWNAECVRITGLEQKDVLAMNILEVISGGSREAFKSYLSLVYTKQSTGNFELQFETSSGATVTVLLNATPRINNAGVVIGVLFVGHDITELYQYRQSLEQIILDKTEKLTRAVEKEKELVNIRNRFVSLASHELRVPLSNIMASAGFVRENSPDPALIEKLVNIECQVGHMRTLIDDLLIIGKADAQKLQPNHQRIDLVHFLNGICAEVMINAQYSHAIEVETSDPVMEITSDPKLLRNVFINLLSNAIKFSPGKPRVLVSVKRCGESMEISVADEGIGINQEDIITVFEPFNRGSNAGAITGTGLGLSIVKRAVETLNGSISVKSELQKGTVFHVTLKK